MTDQTLDTIGKKLKGGERRDAVHFAVAPVTVKGFLRAGERVKLIPGAYDIVMKCGDGSDEPVGIIDPFLEYYVMEGDRCWIFLFPSSITGLRHEWTHPAFPDQQPQLALQQKDKDKAVEYSEQWLRFFADRYCIDYNQMIASITAGEGAYFGNDLDYSDFSPGTEFWRHIRIVTGKDFSKEAINNMSFRCGC